MALTHDIKSRSDTKWNLSEIQQIYVSLQVDADTVTVIVPNSDENVQVQLFAIVISSDTSTVLSLLSGESSSYMFPPFPWGSQYGGNGSPFHMFSCNIGRPLCVGNIGEPIVVKNTEDLRAAHAGIYVQYRLRNVS